MSLFGTSVISKSCYCSVVGYRWVDAKQETDGKNHLGDSV